MSNIGIIGQGFVGTAIREKFRQKFTVYAYDKKWMHPRVFGRKVQLRDLTHTRVSHHADIIFVCVPTPMKKETGECDTSIVESVVSDLNLRAMQTGVRKTVVIKSTIPPGTTKMLNDKYTEIEVCFSPEFLTEANATEDFANQNRIVIGTEDTSAFNKLKDAFKKVFGKKAEYVHMQPSEAEMVKYMTNLFLATKVSFFNDMKRVCDKLNIDYNNVIDATLLDNRIGKTHYMVPGPDGNLGFGGHCFPKDLQAIIHLAQQLNLILPTVEGTWTSNEMVRENKDWLKMEGRAVI